MDRAQLTDVRQAPASGRSAAQLCAGVRGRLPLRAAYALMGVLLAAYLGSLIARPPQQSSQLIDGWLVAGFEIVASAMCLARGLLRRSGRAVALTLGFGLLMWSVGDVVLTLESTGGGSPATPSLADAFYLGFYPFTYVAVVIFMRGEVRKLATPSWLDGAVAGVGAASACAAFFFEKVLHLTGDSSAATATHLAYPAGDLLLLSLVVGGSALMSGRRKAPWLLLAAGIAINAAGDTANLLGSASTSRLDGICDAIAWPTSILLMSMAVWMRPRPSNPLAVQKPSTFVIPGLSAACAVVVLVVGNLHPTSRLALGLATATLVLVGIRLVTSVRGMRTLSQQRRHLSLTDELTGLGNRRCLSTVLDAFFADFDPTAPTLRSLAFLFIDLDHFKEVNDTFGHSAGDALLKLLGPRLAGCLRSGDLLIRLGGDEFVVVLVDGDADYATAVAQRLTEGLIEPFVLDTASVRIGASIGIALAPTDASDSATLLRCADVAMYRAKLGGTPYAIYQPDLDKIGNRLLLLTELRAAIQDGQLLCHYQPQLNLSTGQVVAVEALLRWAHPRLGLVEPLEFLPLAEEAGLMGSITTLVLTGALTQAAAWRRAGTPLSVSVNVSPTNLLDPRFASLLRNLLQTYHVPAGALVLEVTSDRVLPHVDRFQSVIQELSDQDVIVSVGDFGAGLTSLGHLAGLAVKELKLGRACVARLTSDADPRDVDYVRAAVEFCHALGVRVVAEGVEDDPTLQLLSSVGCDLGQGYLISKPKPADRLELTPRTTSWNATTDVG